MSDTDVFQYLIDTVVTGIVFGCLTPFTTPLWKMIKIMKIPKVKGRSIFN